MKQIGKDIAAIVLVAMVSIITITGAVAGFYGAFVSRQAVVETQLAHIQQELAAISATIGEREDRVHDLARRLAQVEIKVQYQDRRIEYYARLR